MLLVILIGVAVVVVVGLVVAYRYGIPAGWPQHNVTAEITFKDDHETDGFKSDWSRHRPEPPAREPGPDWDS
jgi:hypothetical protein